MEGDDVRLDAFVFAPTPPCKYEIFENIFAV